MNLQQASTTSAAREQPTLSDYFAIARFDHMTKHVFIIPEIVLGYMLAKLPVTFPILWIIDRTCERRPDRLRQLCAQ